MSSKDLKIRFDSQFCRMNCQIFSWPLSSGVPVRTDYTTSEVRRFAQRAKDAAQARRLLAIAAVLDGASRLQERDVAWNLEGLGAMPAGLIEEKNSVSARSDLVAISLR